MPRYKLTIAYDGTDFCGWQKQEPPDGSASNENPEPSTTTLHRAPFGEHTPQMESVREGRVALRTVQGVLEQAVRGVIRQDPRLMGASRTDSGVHARGQIAAFTASPKGDIGDDPQGGTATLPDGTIVRGIGWPIERGTERLVLAINGRLPDDVRVLSAEVASDSFDPIGDVESKAYAYTIVRAMQAPLWDRRYVYHVQRREPLDIPAMQAAAALLVGEHDFAAFAAAGHGRLTTVRTVLDCTITHETLHAEGGERVRIDISGTGFLWNMVRIIAGTLLEVGQHRRTLDEVREALATGNRRKAGATLGPQGLCLQWIRYKHAGATISNLKSEI